MKAAVGARAPCRAFFDYFYSFCHVIDRLI